LPQTPPSLKGQLQGRRRATLKWIVGYRADTRRLAGGHSPTKSVAESWTFTELVSRRKQLGVALPAQSMRRNRPPPKPLPLSGTIIPDFELQRGITFCAIEVNLPRANLVLLVIRPTDLETFSVVG